MVIILPDTSDGPVKIATADDQHLWALVSVWVDRRHTGTTAPIAAALKEWAKAKQLT
jgi:hypothetical protein